MKDDLQGQDRLTNSNVMPRGGKNMGFCYMDIAGGMLVSRFVSIWRTLMRIWLIKLSRIQRKY